MKSECLIRELMERAGANARLTMFKTWRKIGGHGYPPPFAPISIVGPRGANKFEDFRKKYTCSEKMHKKYWRNNAH